MVDTKDQSNAIVYAMLFVDSVDIYSENYWKFPCKTWSMGFWWESFLIFPFIYLQVDLRSNLHIGLFDLVNPLISADRNYSIHHTQTSLFGNCAGGSQGVQFLDRSNKDQVRAIRLRRVWGSWHPSI